jgi:hypothetical protein
MWFTEIRDARVSGEFFCDRDTDFLCSLQPSSRMSLARPPLSHTIVSQSTVSNEVGVMEALGRPLSRHENPPFGLFIILAI